MSLPVLLVPHAPLLVRPLSGAQDVAAGLRAVCLDALAELLATRPRAVVVVGGDDVGAEWPPDTPVDVRRFGTTGPRTGPGLPLSLGVVRWLLDEAGWGGTTELHALGWDAPNAELDELAARLWERDGAAVVLAGEGSARRGEKAPGYIDHRAFGFDDSVAGALAQGNAAALRELDADLARDLMVSGRSVLRLLGWLAGESAPERTALRHREDPFGVDYLVASWVLAEPSNPVRAGVLSTPPDSIS